MNKPKQQKEKVLNPQMSEHTQKVGATHAQNPIHKWTGTDTQDKRDHKQQHEAASSADLTEPDWSSSLPVQ